MISQCNFDSGQTCTFTQDTVDNFNWNTGQGVGGGIAPEYDHSLGTSVGRYSLYRFIVKI